MFKCIFSKGSGFNCTKVLVELTNTTEVGSGLMDHLLKVKHSHFMLCRSIRSPVYPVIEQIMM